MLKRHGKFYVYIVECRDGTYYTGYTADLKKRVALHNKGTGSKYVRSKRPVKIVYTRRYAYFKNALRSERDIKKLSRRHKEQLVSIYQKVNITRTLRNKGLKI